MQPTAGMRPAGFTLIELVVVIALLGILAAFAIPRFASLESEARSAVTQGLSGSVRSAAAMAHGLHLATGAASVDMEGNAIAIVGLDFINISIAGFNGLGKNNRRLRPSGNTTTDRNISDFQKVNRTIWAIGFVR